MDMLEDMKAMMNFVVVGGIMPEIGQVVPMAAVREAIAALIAGIPEGRPFSRGDTVGAGPSFSVASSCRRTRGCNHPDP